MYFVLGLLTAGLLALAITPAIWRRAARLTKARVESAVPMSLAEIQAGRDHLRAEFAVATRRLELTAGRLESKANEQAIELDRRRQEVARLNREQAERAEAVAVLERRMASLGEELKLATARLDGAHADLARYDLDMAERGRLLAETEAARNQLQQLSDELKLEVVARNTEIGNLNDVIAAARASEAAITLSRDQLSGALGVERTRAATLEAQLAARELDGREHTETVERQARELREREAELTADRARRDALAADVARLETERKEHLDELALRVGEIERLREELAAANAGRAAIEEKLATAETALAETRTEISALRMKVEAESMTEGDNVRKAIAATEAEKAALEARVTKLEADYTTVLAENAELRRAAGTEWQSERMENARLRERLAEIAANVMRFTATMTGPEAAPSHPAQEGNGDGSGKFDAPTVPPPSRASPEAPRPQAADAPRSESPSLAERLRALQHAAARH